MYFMAATSLSAAVFVNVTASFFGDKKNGGFDFKSHHSPNGHDYGLLHDGFFSFAVVRQIIKNIVVIWLSCSVLSK